MLEAQEEAKGELGESHYQSCQACIKHLLCTCILALTKIFRLHGFVEFKDKDLIMKERNKERGVVPIQGNEVLLPVLDVQDLAEE